MNRRALLQSLSTLPLAAATTIAATDLKPGDLVVITFPGVISEETAERIKQYAERYAFNGAKVLVLDDGGTISSVVKGIAKQNA